MRLLVDTCAFLWWIDEHARLSAESKRLFADPDNEVFLSVVSAWEIALKYSMKRLTLSDKPEQYVPRYRKAHGITALSLDEDASLHLTRLPPLHKDPFDRMLICQAITNGLTIVTPDPLITQYPVRTAW